MRRGDPAGTGTIADVHVHLDTVLVRVRVKCDAGTGTRWTSTASNRSLWSRSNIQLGRNLRSRPKQGRSTRKPLSEQTINTSSRCPSHLTKTTTKAPYFQEVLFNDTSNRAVAASRGSVGLLPVSGLLQLGRRETLLGKTNQPQRQVG